MAINKADRRPAPLVPAPQRQSARLLTAWSEVVGPQIGIAPSSYCLGPWPLPSPNAPRALGAAGEKKQRALSCETFVRYDPTPNEPKRTQSGLMDPMQSNRTLAPTVSVIGLSDAAMGWIRGAIRTEARLPDQSTTYEAFDDVVCRESVVALIGMDQDPAQSPGTQPRTPSTTQWEFVSLRSQSNEIGRTFWKPCALDFPSTCFYPMNQKPFDIHFADAHHQ